MVHPGSLTAFASGVKNGLRVITTGTPQTVDYLPMDVGDNAVIRFYGCVPTAEDGARLLPATAAQMTVTAKIARRARSKDLTNAALRLDEDRGSGRTADEG